MTEFFNGVDPNATQVSPAPVADPALNAQTPQPALIGEGKKYKDTLAADKALADKDAFIEKLKQENADLRTSSTKMTTMEEALKRIEAKNMQTANGESPTAAPVAPATTPVDPNKIDEMVEAKVSKIAQREKEETNRLLVANTLTKKFGDAQRANEIIEQRAQELNVPRTWLEQQARVAPLATLKLLIPEGIPPATQGIPPGNQMNNSTPAPVNLNPLKDPGLLQFGKYSVDGKTFVVQDSKGWQNYIASKHKL